MAEKKKVGEKNSLLANALSSAIGGIVHACVEQPFTTPVEASITQVCLKFEEEVFLLST
jgi:hypothetical protein